MEDLIKKIAASAGISDEQAKKAAETAMAYVKEHADKDGFMDKVSNFAGDAKDKLGDFAEGAKDKLGDFAEGAKDKFEDLQEGASEAFGKLKGFASGIFGGDKDEKKVEEPKKEDEKK